MCCMNDKNRHATPGVAVVLVATKADLLSQRAVSYDEVMVS